MPDQAEITERIDIAVGRRVRILRSRRFEGMTGRVVERDRRLPFSRVELDKLPIGCIVRTRWFPNERLDWL